MELVENLVVNLALTIIDNQELSVMATIVRINEVGDVDLRIDLINDEVIYVLNVGTDRLSEYEG